MESVCISRFTMNNIAPILEKCWTHKIAFKIISKMPKQANFFYSQPSTLTLPKVSTCKVLLFYNFWFTFYGKSVAPTRSSTSYAYLLTNIGNRNLNPKLTRGGGRRRKESAHRLVLPSAVLKR